MNQFSCVVLVILTAVPSHRCQGSFSTSWRPISSPSTISSSNKLDYQYGLTEEDSILPEEVQLSHKDVDKDQCSLFKVVMDQQLYFEYVHYQIDLPDLREFTLCMWQKFKNHTNDHILFSYAVSKQPRSILSWISNTGRSSYYMMSVNGHTLYRLNYPLQLNRWYHSCQSWNGQTGEWQIWVNDERVGRGFNNRLVGNVIKGGGMAISGQEQQQLGGEFFGHYRTSAGSIGMLGELTMVQMYKVALTAGKAHRDHKHHHAHHFEHGIKNEVPSLSTTQASTVAQLPPTSSYLTGGQLNYQVKINPGAHIQVIRNGVTLRHPGLNTQTQSPPLLPPIVLYDQSTVNSVNIPALADLSHDSTGNRNMRSIPLLPHVFQKDEPVNRLQWSLIDREHASGKGNTSMTLLGNTHNETKLSTNHAKTISKGSEDHQVKKIDDREETRPSSTEKPPTKRKRREVAFVKRSEFDYPILKSSSRITTGTGETNDHPTGLTILGSNVKARSTQSGQNDREPAEDEVRKVMNLCDGCTKEPFERALIMAWRSVPKKLYFGARHQSAIQACKTF